MANIHRQRDIIDRRALAEELAQTSAGARSALDRSVLLPPLKEALARGRAEIRVVVVAPGMVHTDFVPGRTEEMMAKAAMATPLKRAIEAEDVALAVISCVTHLTHTTGSIISVDAGRHL